MAVSSPRRARDLVRLLLPVAVLAAALAAPVAAFAVAPDFQAAAVYGVFDPEASAFGDLNRDGAADMVVADTVNDQLVVQLGNGDGSFGDPWYVAVSTPYDLAIADMNRDGSLDVVTADGPAGTVSVLLGDGNGELSAPDSVATGGLVVNAIAVADFTFDTYPDVAAVSIADSTLSVLWNDEIGGLASFSTENCVDSPADIVAGEFNKDSSPDLVIAGSGTNLLEFRAGDGGTFSTVGPLSATGHVPVGIAAADMNQDGAGDVVVVNNFDDEVALMLGDAAGAFTLDDAAATGMIPSRVVATDFNGDGLPDVAVAHDSSDGLYVWRMNGGGFGGLSTFTISGPVMALSAADLNGDAKPDLAASQYMDGVQTVLINTTAWEPVTRSWGPASATGEGAGTLPAALVSADFDRDGDVDFVSMRPGTTNMRVHLNDGTGLFVDGQTIPAPFAGFNPKSATVLDVNANGRIDLAVTDAANNAVAVFTNDGTGTFTYQRSFGTLSAPSDIVAFDLDHDVYPDLAVAATGSTKVQVYRGQSFPLASFGFVGQFELGENPGFLTAGDFDRDGYDDLVCTTVGSGSATWAAVLLNTRSGDLTRAADVEFGEQIAGIDSADFNGDGALDLGVATASGVALVDGLGDGTFVVRPAVAAPAGMTPYSVTTGDFDQDGDVELAVGDFATANSKINWYHASTGGFVFDGEAAMPGNQLRIQSFDYDLDGLLDLSGVSRSGNESYVTTAALTLADTVAPVTTAFLAPPTPDGNAGWYVTEPLLNLTLNEPGAIEWVIVGDLGSNPYTGPITVGEGSAGLEWAGIDLAGNREATRSATFLVDTTPPTTSIFGIPAGWVTSDVQFTLTASDLTSGVDTTAYGLNGGFPVTYSVPVTISAEGTTTIAYGTSDVAGNLEVPNTAYVLIDRTAPQVGAVGVPSGPTSQTVHLSFATTETMSGLAAIYYTYNGGPENPWGGGTIDISDQGTSTITYRAVDNVGNSSGVSTATVVMDKTQPSTTASGVPSDWVTGTVNLTLSAEDAGVVNSGIAATHYSVDGGARQTYTGASIAVSGDGTHTVGYRSVDGAGNVEGTKTATVRIDNAAPAVAILGAPSGPTSQSVTISFAATDTLSGVAGIRYSVNGGSESTYSGVPFTYSGEGSRTIAYRAVDNAGNSTGVTSVDVLIDFTAPSTDPQGFDTGWISVDHTVTLTAADSLSGVAATYYRLNGGAPQLYGGPFSVTAEGTTAVTVWSVDAAGNAEVPWDGTVLIDKHGPTIASDHRAAYEGTATINFSATDALSGVAGLERSLDGGPFSAAGSITVTDPGTHTLDLSASDVAGNLSTTPTIGFLVAPAAPPTTTISALPGGWVSSDVTFTLSALDYTGVAATYYTLNGGATQTYTGVITVSSEGTTAIQYWSEDTLGNIEAPHSDQIRIDRTIPVVTATKDRPGAWTSFDVNVGLSLADDGYSPISSILYSVDATNPTTSYTTTFTITAEGAHVVYYRATDSAGNGSSVQTIAVGIDRTAPDISVTPLRPDLGLWWKSVPFSMRATDTLSGMGSISLGVDGAFRSSVGGNGETTLNGAVTVADEGTHTVSWWGEDFYGNTAGSQSTPLGSVEIYVDKTAPASQATTTGTTAAQTVTLSATDALSGVAGIRYSVDGAAAATYSVPFSVAGTGAHLVERAAVDNAGNVETTQTISVINTEETVDRLSGARRYNVAVEIARKKWPSYAGVKDVIVVSGEDAALADAFSAAGLAGLYNAPILLVSSHGPASFNTPTYSEISSMTTANTSITIHVVGGPASVSSTIYNNLSSRKGPGGVIERLGGSDRYGVASGVAQRMNAVLKQRGGALEGIIIYNAETPAAAYDALAASTIAARKNYPMVAVRKSSVPPAASSVLGKPDFVGKPRYLASGTAYLTGSVPAGVGSTTRMATSSARDTAATQIATFAKTRGWLAYANTGLANALPDALTGGAFMGLQNGILLYTNASPLSSVTNSFVTANRVEMTQGYVFGGPGSITDSTAAAFKAAMQ